MCAHRQQTMQGAASLRPNLHIANTTEKQARLNKIHIGVLLQKGLPRLPAGIARRGGKKGLDSGLYPRV
jgi:hypothetical protein